MRLLGIILTIVWMMVTTTVALVVSKWMGADPVAGWSWWAVWAPMWGPMLVVTILAFCVATQLLIVRLERRGQ